MTQKDPADRVDLERRIYETVLSFPGRIDEMEIRSEDACRLLARQIADVVLEQDRHGVKQDPR